MHSPRQGARFLGRFLRARRRALGLARAEAVRRSPGGGGEPGLTLSVLRDLEAGDRLPTLGRLPGLARALGLHPAELLAWVSLAPVLEAAEAGLGTSVDGLPRSLLLREGARRLDAAQPAEAAVLALAASRKEPGGGRLPLLLARAVLALDRPVLALLLAGRAAPGEGRLPLELEALRRLGLGALARRALPARGGGPALAAVRIRLLEETDPDAAGLAWARRLEAARREGDARAAAEAAAGVARCLALSGKLREAARYRRERDRWSRALPARVAPPGPAD